MSKASALCEKIIEACWLAAIILAPLFFNVYSSRSFEPDKMSLVRTLALVMLAAWLVIRAERLRLAARTPGQAGGPDTLRPSVAARLRALLQNWSSENPLILPTLALMIAYIISTIASVSPTLSLFGSYTRMQGTYATFSYIVIFLLAANTLRDKSQLNRAVNVALLTSFPVAFYGLIQHYFLDPLPWGGDVNTRVASNMGNSIFVGAFLIMVIPLALGRLVQNAEQAAGELTRRARLVLYGLVVLTVGVLVAAWGLLFEVSGKRLIEGQLQDQLNPAQLAAALSNFNTAFIISILVVLAWWAAGFFLKKRAGLFLLVGIYSFLLTVQLLTLFFTQSRGPLLGMIAGLFAFVLLYALARGAHRLALGGMAAAALVGLLLILANVSAGTPLAGLRSLPYVGRLGQILETEGGTGRVRVLIWQGALPLVLPHAPLWSPTSGDDLLNSVRPLIGYGPETLFVSYSRFYPPELAHLEARNATPDRSHNETFDALTSTGLLGFIAENILFLSIVYFGLKWLGLVKTPRERNILIALWYLGGLLTTIFLGLTMGWYFLGVGFPAGMLGGLFVYLAGIAVLRRHEELSASDPVRSLFLVMFLAAIIAHFTEIHFGIAIVSTRTYFWFLAALLVYTGVRYTRETAPVAEPAALPVTEPADSAALRARRRKARRAGRDPLPVAERRPKAAGGARVISTTPLLTQAFLAGLVLATMAFDYITNINVRAAAGQAPMALDIISSALTLKQTVAGLQFSPAMLWMFVATLSLMLAIAMTEWAGDAALPLREWAMAVGLYLVLALAILSSFLLYHTLLIGTGSFDATFATVTLFVVFILIMVVVIAITLLMDAQLSPLWVARPTNWIVAPILALIAAILIFSSNVSTVQADMIYKQAVALAGGNTLQQSIDLYQRALSLEPSQDYYWLFLGRSYLQLAQSGDATMRPGALANAEKALQSALGLNPLNTDHSANLARLHQAWASFSTDAAAREGEYKKAFQHYQAAIRLSPNTAHLYDQYAQALVEYAGVQQGQKNIEGAAQTRQTITNLLAQSARLDSSFCLTNAVRSETDSDWQGMVDDSLATFRLLPSCFPFGDDARATASQSLAAAMDKALAAGEGSQYGARLEQAVAQSPTVEIYTALLNYYSKSGQINASIHALDAALALLPESDSTTRKQYTDFRTSLVSVQQAISQTVANPNDAEAHRKLADMWLVRSQLDLALPEYQKVAALLPGDYPAHRMVTLVLVRQSQLAQASQSLTATLELAPANDRPLWEHLGTILAAAQNGKKEAALTAIQDLLKTAPAQDQQVKDALAALSNSLQSGN